jgi:hypothetical protein
MLFNLFCQFVLCTLHGGADLTFSILFNIFNVKSFFNEIINILLILVKLINYLSHLFYQFLSVFRHVLLPYKFWHHGGAHLTF